MAARGPILHRHAAALGQHAPALALRRHGLPRAAATSRRSRSRSREGARRAGRRERAGRAPLPQGARARGTRTSRRSSTQGKTVRTIELEPDRDWERAARETIEAMRDGVDVVYQGVLASDGWRGQADFLMRVETPSRSARGATRRSTRSSPATRSPPTSSSSASTASSSPASRALEPAHIHVLLGNQTSRRRSRRTSSAPTTGACGARLERLRRRPAATTEPFPVDQCRICDFKPLCDAHWDAVDHLCRVAGIQPRPDREARGARGRHARRARRARTTSARPAGMAEATFEKLHEQAALQLRRARPARTAASILTPQPASGFALLPDPSPGDLFFDFEGNPFWDSEGSLEYLWGYSDRDDAFTRALGDEPRRGAGGLRDVRRPRARAARGAPRTCTSTTTPSTRSRRCGG